MYNNFKMLIAVLIFGQVAYAMEKTSTQERKNNLLIQAATRCNPYSLSKMLSQGADFNARDAEHGATILHWAVGSINPTISLESRLATVNYIFSKTELDVNAENNQGTTALMLAIYQNQDECAESILADPRVSLTHCNKRGDSALSYARIKGKTRLLDLMNEKLDTEPTIICYDNDQRISDFMECGLKPYQELYRMLMRTKEAAPTRARAIVKNKYAGLNAFFLALSQGNIPLVKLLIEAGVLVDQHYETTNRYAGAAHSESPEMLARHYKHHELAALLKAYKDFIILFIQNKATEKDIEEFIEKGFFISFRSIGTESGETALGAEERGVTPLHCAIEHNNNPLKEALIEAGADMYATDSQGKTPLDYGYNPAKIVKGKPETLK